MGTLFRLFLAAAFFSIAPATAEEDSYNLTVTAFAPPGTPWDEDWTTFRQHIEANAGGRINLKLLIRGEAGGEPIMMTNIRRNRTQFGGFTLSGAAAVIPELSVLVSPYLFQDVNELDYVMDRHMLDYLQPLFAEKGLVLLRWAETGWLNMYGKRPILLPRDAANYRLRSQASVASQALVRSLGGDLLQMPFQDLIPALQTGLVDGGETNVILYSIGGIVDEAPHYTLTRHAYETGIVVVNKAWFDALPPDLRTVVDEAFPSSDASRAAIRGMSRSLQAGLTARGARLHELTPEQRAVWIAATKDNHKEIIAEVGGRAQGVYDALMAGKRDYQAHKMATTENGDGSR